MHGRERHLLLWACTGLMSFGQWIFQNCTGVWGLGISAWVVPKHAVVPFGNPIHSWRLYWRPVEAPSKDTALIAPSCEFLSNTKP